MFGHAGDHVLRRLAEALRPVLPDQIVIAADAAGGDDHRLRAQREIADDFARRTLAARDRSGSRTAPLTPSTAPLVITSVSTRWRNLNVAGRSSRLARAALERLDDAGAGAPGDVKARHRIAMAHRVIAAALGPADHRENTVSHRAQPVALFAGRERNIGFRPALRPMVVIAVEARGAHPVLQREIVGILDAKPALFRKVDQKQTAERPKCLAAQALVALLIDDDDALAGVGDFGRGHQPRQSAADHDYVCVISHRVLPIPFWMKPAAFVAVNGKSLLACGGAATRCGASCSTLGPFRPEGAARCNT